MSIKRIDVAPVYVTEQDNALEFYVNKPGMETVRDDPMGPGRPVVQVKPDSVRPSRD